MNTTPVFLANRNSKAKVVVNQGGTSSSKTFSIVQLLFLKAIEKPKQVITVTGESLPNLRKGSYRDAEYIYSNTDFIKANVVAWNKTDRVILFKNGSIIEFISNLDEQSAKNGKRDILFVNEANGISWAIFWQLAIRTRGQIFLDYNPTTHFWAHEKLIGTTPESNDLSATVQLIISDHRHNTFLTAEDHAKIEGIKDKELWNVYARGRTGNLTGLIFPEWRMIPNDQFPKDAPFCGGLDFGYTNDPTAGVKKVKIGNNLYLDEMCYTAGLAPVQIAQIFKTNGFTTNNIIFCDHDPDMIRDLRMAGMMAVRAEKGQGSVNSGITRLKQYNVYYTERSVNLHMEKGKYMWAKDPATGKSLNTPIDAFNHCFVGSTSVITIEGDKSIVYIKENDLVFTSQGYRKVIKKWNNGYKQVNKYVLQLDILSVYLCCTSEHLIKTESGWIQISKLQSGMTVCLNSLLMERHISSIKERGIFQGDAKKCTFPFGSSIMAKLKRAFMFIIRTKTDGIIKLKTSNKKSVPCIKENTFKKEEKKIQSFSSIYKRLESKKQESGMVQKKVVSGIKYMLKTILHLFTQRILKDNVNVVVGNICLVFFNKKQLGFVPINANQNGEGNKGLIRLKGNAPIVASYSKQASSQKPHIVLSNVQKITKSSGWMEEVYDLTVEDCHEYFANGVLVHNCMDAVRYSESAIGQSF